MNAARPDRVLRLGVLLSGSGRTLENLLAQRAAGALEAEVVAVASNKVGVRGLAIAAEHHVPVRSFRLSEYQGDRRRRDAAMLEWVRAAEVDLILLAGYLALLDLSAKASWDPSCAPSLCSGPCDSVGAAAVDRQPVAPRSVARARGVREAGRGDAPPLWGDEFPSRVVG